MGRVGNVAMRFSCGVKSANFGVMVVGGCGVLPGSCDIKECQRRC